MRRDVAGFLLRVIRAAFGAHYELAAALEYWRQTDDRPIGACGMPHGTGLPTNPT
jgi:hypothetical protein